MNREIAILAGLIALAGSGSAQASHQVIYAPATKSSASSHAHQGPYVQASFMDVTNTTVNYTSTGPGGTATHGPLLATSSSVATTQPGGYADLSFGSSSSASADLATGRLKASVGAYGPEFYGSPLGFAESSLYDTLFFTNNSGGDVSLTFRYSFDGSVIDTLNASSPGGVASRLIRSAWKEGARPEGAGPPRPLQRSDLHRAPAEAGPPPQPRPTHHPAMGG